MTIQILYGRENSYHDVTQMGVNGFYHDGKLEIPASDDQRARILGDPLPGIIKEIVIINTEKSERLVYLAGEKIEYSCVIDKKLFSANPKSWRNKNFETIDKRVQYIHTQLHFIGGNIKDEYPEQLLAAEFITPEAKVLELGSNIGRNTLIIASHLENDSQLVTLECDPKSVELVEKNRQLNEMNFKVEPSALSARKLYQVGWDTYPEERKPLNSVEVPTITWEELNQKYSIEFDTLVADCEGALYYILLDFPEILDKIKLIVVENDYTNLSHKNYVDQQLRKSNFQIRKQLAGGWGPCYSRFYEVWIK